MAFTEVHALPVIETESSTDYNVQILYAVFALYASVPDYNAVKTAAMLNINNGLQEEDQVTPEFSISILIIDTVGVFLSLIAALFVSVVVSSSPRSLVVVSFRLWIINRVVVRVVGRVVGGTNLNLKDEHSTSGIWKDVGLFDGESGSNRSLERCPT